MGRSELLGMSESDKTEDIIYRCPKCKGMVKASEYDMHVASGHAQYRQEVKAEGIIAKGPLEKGVPWYADIFDMMHDYPRAFVYSSTITFFLGLIMEYYWLAIVVPHH
jgi:uncharacterized C2H2 Zn-finger protein